MKTMKWMMFVLLLVLAGCKGKEDALKLLKEREWQLKAMQMNGEAVTYPSELPVLLFSDSTAVYGTAGCNHFFGEYEADAEGHVTVRPGGATMMSCPDLEFENNYLKALSQVKHFQIADGELTLKDAAGNLRMVYVLPDSDEKQK